MRWYLVLAVGLLALLLQKQSLMAQTVPLPQNNSVKLRLEIEIQGVLSVTEKSATITNKEKIFEWVKVDASLDYRHDPPKVIESRFEIRSREMDKVWVLELDENLKKTAKTLHGKEIVLTGKCLVFGIRSQADTGKTPATIGYQTLPNHPRAGGPGMTVPIVVPEGFATAVQSQLLLDDRVTVISLKAAK